MNTDPIVSESFDESHAKLWEIIKSSRFAMLTTIEDGALRARPMTTVQKDFGGTLWFFAPAHSAVAHAIESNEQVCVAYANADKADFVSMSGVASLVNHAAIKEKLWSPMVQAWFPQGASSQEVALIKVDITNAEYWDSIGNKLVHLYSMARAYVRGTTPKNISEHRQVKM